MLDSPLSIHIVNYEVEALLARRFLGSSCRSLPLLLNGALSGKPTVVVKDVGFIITQEKASAQMLHANTVLGDKTQNQIKVRYFNKYQDRLVETYLEDLDYDYINNHCTRQN